MVMIHDRTSPRVPRPRGADVATQTARAIIGLRDALVRGDFDPGERLAELPLVARLGISRTPIRLALERLAHMGLVDADPGGGFSVRSYTLDDALDAIELRGVLEGAAARLAAERLTDSTHVWPLRHLSDEMEGLGHLTLDSFGRYMSLNDAFHGALIALSRSAMLKRTYDHAVSVPFASPSAMVLPATGLPRADDTLALAREHHRSIAEAIASRQGTRAEALAREHALIGRRVLLTALGDGEIVDRIPGASLIRPWPAARREAE